MQTSAPPENLREDLILAGLDLLAEAGMAGLTLRKVAARAGVSHAAPAHHFAGLPGLLTAIAARAHQRFSAAMEGARDRAEPTPMARLQGICAGYITFAASQSGLFQLMFTTPGLLRDDPALRSAASHAYLVLREACAPFASTPPEALETAVWSLVHGYAQLGFDRPQGNPAPTAEVPAFAALLERLVRGGDAETGDQEALASPDSLR